MAFRSYYGFRPYVPVAQRRLQAQKTAKKMSGKGRVLAPVLIEGRTIATTFWGQAWCKNLESYSDYANRLPRGRTYVRNGSVIDLQIASGAITALVQGSSLYALTIKIKPLDAKRWAAFKQRCAGRVTNLLDLLQGRLSKEILADLTAHDTGLFPAPAEIELGCSCPDWADMCKHVAAVLYGVGARLDREPALFFTLRGVDMQELIGAASAAVTTDLAGSGPSETALVGADLAALFGVELDSSGAAPAPVPPPVPAASASGVVAAGSRARRAAKSAAQPGPEPAAKARSALKVSSTSAALAPRSPLKPAPAKKNAKHKPLPRAKRPPSRPPDG